MTLQQRNSIQNPIEGLIVYCTNCGRLGNEGALSVYVNGKWIVMASCVVNPATESTHVVSPNQIIWNWLITGTDGVKWNTINNYDDAIDLGAALSKTETGIVCDSTYLRYIWTYSECGVSEATILSVTTENNIPQAPVAGAHIATPTQITWIWGAVSGALGYKWNTINDFNTATDIGSQTTTTQVGLDCETQYTKYLWAYNSCSPSTPTLLTQSTDTCPDCEQQFIDYRDGQVYSTTLIGGQCWMTQNLNIGLKVNGSINQTNNQLIEKYCYDDLESNCDVYGGLYQLDEAMQYVFIEGVQGICPIGWHLPTNAEWVTLTTFLGGEAVAGGKMKESGTTHWASPNTGATNSSGFTALASGVRHTNNSTFIDLTQTVSFWMSQNNSSSKSRRLYYNNENVGFNQYLRTQGYSVRCLKD